MSKTNANQSNNVVVTASKARSIYAKQREASCRTFSAYLKVLRADADALNVNALAEAAKAAEAAAKEAAKEAKADATKADAAKHAKQIAEAAKARAEAARTHLATDLQHVNNLRNALDKSAFNAEDINPNFLRTWLDFAVDANDCICDCKRIALEDEAEARKTLDANRLKDIDGTLIYLKPITLWTFAKVMQKFASAAKQRAKHIAAGKQIEREAKRAEAEAKRIEAYRAKIADYEAKQQRNAADAKILADAAAEAAAKQNESK